MSDVGWKKVFKDKVLAPLVIGAIMMTIGQVFEIQEIFWSGIGVAFVGWYFVFRGRD